MKRETIRASEPPGFTFFRARVSGETARHDLSHPARTKKQIDASSHYNSLPPLPCRRSGYAISAGHRTTDKTSFIIRARRPRGAFRAARRRSADDLSQRASPPGISPSTTGTVVARDSTGRENLSRQRRRTRGSRITRQCVHEQYYTQSRGQALNQRRIYAPV